MSKTQGPWAGRHATLSPLLLAAAPPRVVATQARRLAEPTALTVQPGTERACCLPAQAFQLLLLQLKLLLWDYFVKIGFQEWDSASHWPQQWVPIA